MMRIKIWLKNKLIIKVVVIMIIIMMGCNKSNNIERYIKSVLRYGF